MADKELQQQSVGTSNSDLQSNGLTKHQQALLDYASMAAKASNQVQTEEIVARTHHIVKTEIHTSFEQYSKMTMSRRVLMAVGAVLMFGAGFLVKGTLVARKEDPTNHVND